MGGSKTRILPGLARLFKVSLQRRGKACRNLDGRSAKKSKIKLALLQKTGIVTGLLLHVSP
ncbi:hypothetical protein [Pseudomonas lopnurensis]|uniref:hypothetical protein n=1 Tax=Pseudomonas lopnurensis TaxID=1477517 RepID=UPI00187A2BB7|nr:hypothetical protein [Pseudomonas lopnurensis]MBE7376792.1 hypothetical protein [Pseudomonas lopnurensis]